MRFQDLAMHLFVQLEYAKRVQSDVNGDPQFLGSASFPCQAWFPWHSATKFWK